MVQGEGEVAQDVFSDKSRGGVRELEEELVNEAEGVDVGDCSDSELNLGKDDVEGKTESQGFKHLL